MAKGPIERLAARRNCPRCNFEKTGGNALCRRSRYKLPANMREPLEKIVTKETSVVERALRAAARYFEVHYASIRRFGGGRVY
jgi:hypothetical protein